MRDPRVQSGKSTELVSKYYDKDPYPKFFEETVEPNKTKTVLYQNGTEEVSEVKRIQIRGHPDMTVAVRRLKDNQDQAVSEQRRLGDLPTIDGWYQLEFRRVSADVPLIIDKNQVIFLDFNHIQVGNQTVKCVIDKQAVRFYLGR
jgi:hypothetical protein